jgi:hypothetical protein
MRKKKDKKVHSIGFQFSNSTTKVYYNDPQIAVEIGAASDTSPYRVKVNGDTIGCETIAKVIIDGKIHTFADPFMKGSFTARDEVIEWRKQIGLECFERILHAVDPDETAFAEFLKAPFKDGIEAEKKKKTIELKVAKAVREKREAEKPKEPEPPKRIDPYNPNYPASYSKSSYSLDAGPSNPIERLDDDLSQW